MNDDKVKVKLSLREARMLARILGSTTATLHDGTETSYDNQSEFWKLAVSIEKALHRGVSDFCEEKGFKTSGFGLAYKWGAEPVSKGFGSVLKRKVA